MTVPQVAIGRWNLSGSPDCRRNHLFAL